MRLYLNNVDDMFHLIEIFINLTIFNCLQYIKEYITLLYNICYIYFINCSLNIIKFIFRQ